VSAALRRAQKGYELRRTAQTPEVKPEHADRLNRKARAAFGATSHLTTIHRARAASDVSVATVLFIFIFIFVVTDIRVIVHTFICAFGWRVPLRVALPLIDVRVLLRGITLFPLDIAFAGRIGPRC